MSAASMWEEAEGGKEKESKHLDTLFSELMHECKHSAPGARLSARLRTALERLHPETRRAVVSRQRDGCAPLFVAARRGNAELAEYLLHVCAAPVEQRGLYEVPEERASHTVTPLWCASVAGRLEVVMVLTEAGADVNAVSDSGSTPVRSACFMSHLAVVRYLLSKGADLHRPNHNGGTCLINAVQSVHLCALLLAHGAHVDARDMQLKTALHYAIQEHRVETARLLLDHGADPTLTSRSGDDALATACLKGAAQIVTLLMSRVRYSSERCADAFELLGATMLDEFNDPGAALAAWRKATAIRHAYTTYIEKRPEVPLYPALGLTPEWRTEEELEDMDMDALRTQALLVAARVLGAAHRDTVFRLMYRGASYADAFRYQRCVDLWAWALDLRIERDTLLYPDTVHTACAVTRLLLDGLTGRLARGEGDSPRHADARRIFLSLSQAVGPARAALQPAPQHRRQADTFDRALRCITHLIYLLIHTASTPEERAGVESAVRGLVAERVRSAQTGDTLLHLSVSRLNVIKSSFFADELADPSVFPSVDVVRLLLRCGARATERNQARSTPLHVAAIPYNHCNHIVKALLKGGAHLDTPNKFGDSAADLVALNRSSVLRPLRYLTLRCLAARALVRGGEAPARGDPGIPRTLHRFLDLHRV